MLVLSRQRDETITIGDHDTALVPLTPGEVAALRKYLVNTPADVLRSIGVDGLAGKLDAAEFEPFKVTVVDIRGDKVRLGTTAPKCVTVHREEVYHATRREHRVAAEIKPEDLSGLGKILPKASAKRGARR